MVHLFLLSAGQVRVNFMPANTGSGGISNNYHVDPEARRLRFREFLSALRDHGGNAHLAHRRDGDHHRARSGCVIWCLVWLGALDCMGSWGGKS